MIRHTVSTMLAAGMLAALVPQAAPARTKLVTLPDRDRLVVNLENPNYSLLYEERDITLQRGTNHIDFSWQGVHIDKNSIRLSVLGHRGDGPEATKVISVAFPPNEAALTWQVYSPEARTERIRVSYLLHGIARETSYELTANAGETQADFRQFFQMSNTSGEDLGDAAIRIRQADDWTRSVRSGETRRFLAFRREGLPLRKVFETRPQLFSTRGEEGEIIALLYEIDNKGDAGLGTFKLDSGKARLFGEVADSGTIFLGEDYLRETPVGEDAPLTLGTVKDVVLKRRVMSDQRENLRKNIHDNVVLFDRVVHVRYEIENFKADAATVRVIEQLPPDAVIAEVDNGGIETERKSGNEYRLTIELAPRPAGEDVPVREVNLVYRIPNVLAQ